MRTVKRLAGGGLLHESAPGGATHYKPGLDAGGWMHVSEGDAFTDDPSVVTCPVCETEKKGSTA